MVREEEDKAVTVAFMDPVAVLKLTENPEVAKLAGEVRARLERVSPGLESRRREAEAAAYQAELNALPTKP